MALPNPLIKAVPLSRPTKLAAAIDSVATTLYVEDDDAGRDQDDTLIAPIVLTIGIGAGAEEVYCPTAPTDRHYETVTRGSGGTTARSWPKGTPIARRISTTEWDWLVENVADLDERPGVGSEGNVVGPATSTASALARFDDTTGILLKDSAVTVTDAGTVNVPTGQTYNINGVPHGHGTPKLDDLAAPDDTTALDASTSAHGLLPKLPGSTTTFLRGDGAFAHAPPYFVEPDTNGDIQPGLPRSWLELDANGDVQPAIEAADDPEFELDAQGNIQPRG
jgi:hypothetical protein